MSQFVMKDLVNLRWGWPLGYHVDLPRGVGTRVLVCCVTSPQTLDQSRCWDSTPAKCGKESGFQRLSRLVFFFWHTNTCLIMCFCRCCCCTFRAKPEPNIPYDEKEWKGICNLKFNKCQTRDLVILKWWQCRCQSENDILFCMSHEFLWLEG